MHAFFFGRSQITAQSVCSHIIMTEQIFWNFLTWDLKKEIKLVAEFSVSECVQKHWSPDWYFVKKSCCYDHSKLWINLISSVSFCSNITHITYLQTLLSILRTAQDTVFVRFCPFLWWTIPNANSWADETTFYWKQNKIHAHVMQCRSARKTQEVQKQNSVHNMKLRQAEEINAQEVIRAKGTQLGTTYSWTKSE